MDADGNSLSEEDVVLTVKILAQEQDVRSVTGKNEATLKQIRAQSGASVSISDGPSPDRIITVTGTLEELYDACRLVIERFEPYDDGGDNANDVDCLFVKMIVPASQCGPLIGKGGSKIKEIRDSTRAAMQVAADMLPNSTERCVNISGTVDAILDCIYEICLILASTPQKFSVIPYRPNSDLIEGPLVFANGKVYTLQGTIAVPIADLSFLFKNDLAQDYFGANSAVNYSIISHLAKQNTANKDAKEEKKDFHSHDIRVPDEIFGGVIGRNGIKMSDIRQITGAMIIVSDTDEISSDGRERTVTIRGPRESVTLARYLINASIDLQKLGCDSQSNADQCDGIEPESATTSIMNLLTRPGAMNILSNITGFNNVSEFLGSFDPHQRR